MLRILRQGQRWVLWFVILVVGGVFVFYLGLGGIGGGGGSPRSEETVVAVAGRTFSLKDVSRQRQRLEASYRQQIGDAFDPAAMGPYLDETSARGLMRTALLASEAERLGLRATDPEVRDFLRGIPGATDGQGRIDRELVTAYAQREFGTVRRFQESLRDSLLAEKIERLMQASVAVSEGEALQALRLEREEVDVAYVALDPTTPPPNLEIDEASVADLIANEPEQLKTAYEERRAEFELPERVRARHILFRTPARGTPEMIEPVRERAEKALQRLNDGASFADLAMELSEDPGSKEKGGDLGLFGRGRMVKQFEDVAFELEPGETSEVVETFHGFHIIRTEEKRPPENTPLEEANETLARDILGMEAAAAFARQKTAEIVAAVREGSSLIEAARAADVSIERPEALVRRPDGRIPGLGVSPELQAAAFSTEPDTSLDRVFEVDGRRVLLEVLARRTPADEELEPEVEARREQLVQERRTQLQQHWIDTRSKQLSESGDLLLDLARISPR